MTTNRITDAAATHAAHRFSFARNAAQCHNAATPRANDTTPYTPNSTPTSTALTRATHRNSFSSQETEEEKRQEIQCRRRKENEEIDDPLAMLCSVKTYATDIRNGGQMFTPIRNPISSGARRATSSI